MFKKAQLMQEWTLQTVKKSKLEPNPTFEETKGRVSY